MSYQPIDIDHHGHPTLVVPAPERVDIRTLAARPGCGVEYVMTWAGLSSYPSVEWMRRMQRLTTQALCDAGDAAECVTPEMLARAPHRPFDGGRTVGT